MESFVVCRGFCPPEGGARSALIRAGTETGAAAGTLSLAGWIGPPTGTGAVGAGGGDASGNSGDRAGYSADPVDSVTDSPALDRAGVPDSLAALEHTKGVNERATLARCAVPFVACGDLRGFDSDASYPLQLVPTEAELRSIGYSAEAAREQVLARGKELPLDRSGTACSGSGISSDTSTAARSVPLKGAEEGAPLPPV